MERRIGRGRIYKINIKKKKENEKNKEPNTEIDDIAGRLGKKERSKEETKNNALEY